MDAQPVALAVERAGLHQGVNERHRVAFPLDPVGEFVCREPRQVAIDGILGSKLPEGLEDAGGGVRWYSERPLELPEFWMMNSTKFHFGTSFPAFTRLESPTLNHPDPLLVERSGGRPEARRSWGGRASGGPLRGVPR